MCPHCDCVNKSSLTDQRWLASEPIIANGQQDYVILARDRANHYWMEHISAGAVQSEAQISYCPVCGSDLEQLIQKPTEQSSELYTILNRVVTPRGLECDDPQISEEYYHDEEVAFKTALKEAAQAARDYRSLKDGHSYASRGDDIRHPYRAWVEDDKGTLIEEFVVNWVLPAEEESK